MNFRWLRIAPVLIVSITIAAISLSEWLAGTGRLGEIRQLELLTFDWRSRLKQKYAPEPGGEVGIVAIKDDTIKRLNEEKGLNYPFPRSLHGEVLEELYLQDAKTVAYDIFFGGAKDSASDNYFADQIKRHGNVVFSVPDRPWTKNEVDDPADLFQVHLAGVGHAVATIDFDGSIRVINPTRNNEELGTVWAMGFVAAALHLGLDIEDATIESGRTIIIPDGDSEIRIPLDRDGNFVINWGFEDPVIQEFNSVNDDRAVRIQSLTDPNAPPVSQHWKEKAVIIGSTGSIPAIDDRVTLPLGRRLPGCYVHRAIALSVISNSHIQEIGLGWRILILTCLTILVASISWRFKAGRASLILTGLALLYLIGVVLLFLYAGTWYPVVTPLLGAVLTNHGLMAVFRAFYDRQNIKRPHGFFGNLTSSQWRDMTVFFADIRGFSSLLDATTKTGDDPREQTTAIKVVDQYLAAVADAVTASGGTIDKYIGDCVMAFWGAPGDPHDHAARAVHAACEAQRAIAALNTTRAEADESGGELTPVSLGCGLNTGTLLAGFVGSKDNRSNYTVMGHEVNVASRLESKSGHGRIYISKETKNRAIETDIELDSRITSCGILDLKGISEGMEGYEVDWDE